MFYLSQGCVSSRDANQPEHKRQEIQDSRANGARPGSNCSQDQANGQVEAPLQEIKNPTQNAQRQAGRGKMIGGRSRIHVGKMWDGIRQNYSISCQGERSK